MKDIELRLGTKAVAVSRRDGNRVVRLEGGEEVSGRELLVATGRAPRVHGIGLETVGIQADAEGLEIDERCRAADGVWAIGDVTGVLPFTHVGMYQGPITAADIADRDREVLVGAWAVAPMAGEWIHYAALAIKTKTPICVLRDTVAQFPTFTEAYLKGVESLEL